MPTFTELHEANPTPWTQEFHTDDQSWYVIDANGQIVDLECVVAMMNEAANEIESLKLYIDALGTSTKGIHAYSPECVAACIRAVEAEDNQRGMRMRGDPNWKIPLHIEAMDHAISLLPSGTHEE